MPAIQEHHLRELAEQPLGKAYLGEIIRRLVYATVAKRRPGLHFLAGETNNYAGWDGWVEVQLDVGGADVQHRSLWELSTDRNPEKKIRTDYQNSTRKKPPHEWNRHDVIYVAATLRALTPDKNNAIKRALIKDFGNPYWGIVILSATELVQWIEKIPAVESWMATEFKIGTNRFGRSLDHAWREWSEQTVPQVTEQLIAAGRALASVRAALKFDAGPTASVQCDSTEEAVAVVYCAVRGLPESDAHLMLASSVVVRDERAASELVNQVVGPDSMPFAILVPPAATHSQRLVSAGYRVVHAFARKEDSASVLSFERSTVQDFAKALTESMKVPSPDAETQARACGCSVAVWHIRNLFKRPLQPALPPWAEAPSADVVVPAVFLGAWHQQSLHDAEVIRQLSGFEPTKFEGELQKFAQGPTPLLEYIGPDRFIVAPTAAFEFVARNVNRGHIERFEKVCKEVFSKISPEVIGRWSDENSEPRIRNRREELSDGLLDGLAETLLRIAVLGAPLHSHGALGNYSSPQAFVDSLVRDLRGLSSDPRLLASLDHQLPYLIEAAPASFLAALETLIQGRPSDLGRLFADEPGIFGRSFHTGLLWGLESLAWSPEYLARVAEILLGLAALDPGGQLSNRPFNTLCDIFLAWHPGTTAPAQHRADVLRELSERNPKVGWRAVLEQLPGKRRTATTNHKPLWRSLVAAYPRPNRKEIFAAYRLYIELALEIAGENISRLADLLDVYPQLDPSHQTALEEKLANVRLASALADDTEGLWKRAHNLIARHRGFSDAEWALPAQVLDRLERLADRFTPVDAISRNRWLFDEQFPETGYPERDYDGRNRDLDERRAVAITSILKEQGWEGIHRLIKQAAYPHIVGHYVAQLAESNHQVLDAMEMWRAGGSRLEMLALQAASGRRSLTGKAWNEELLAYAAQRNWPAEALAAALLDYPDGSATYSFVSQLPKAVQKEYWTHRLGFIRVPDDDQASFKTAAAAFIEHGRAIDLIDQDWHRLYQLGYSELLGVVDAFIKELTTSSKQIRGGTLDHDVQRVFNWLRKQPEANTVEIARREYALLPLLASYGDSPTSLSLHELLGADPMFFVDVLSDVYRGSADDTVFEGEALERAQQRAHAGFEVLSSWRSPPGVEGGRVDENSLNSWVDTARRALADRDRVDIGDEQIGKILYHLPADEGDRWPGIALCKLLQRLRSEHIERGIEVEDFNARGTTTRAMYEGGAQERALEAKWKQRADALDSRWSRAKGLCIRIAEQWRRHAESEDQSAKINRMRWSR